MENYPIVKTYKAEEDIASLVSQGYLTCDTICLIEDKDIDTDELLREASTKLVRPDEVGEFMELTDDVMPISSIFATNIWNRNDCIFTAGELIRSYQSARYKPINWGHKGSETSGNENIGVMIRTSLLQGDIEDLKEFSEEDYDKVDEDSVDGKIHIRQDGIIWSAYFPSYASLIKKGKKNKSLFVSMECLFSDFAYGIRSSEGGKIQFIERNEDTAYLSKYLRCYKGPGKVSINGKEMLIGRKPINPVFSGQGIVKNPANNKSGKKLSIIFNENSTYGYNSEDNNYSFGVNNDMTVNEVEVLRQQLADMTKKYDEATKRIANLEESAVKAEVDKLKAENQELEAEKSQLDEKVKKLEEDKKVLETTKAELEELKSKFEAASKELNDIRASEKARTRLSELQAVAGDKFTDNDLDDIKKWDDATFDLIKATLIKAGVSNEPKLTDQSVSNENKMTDQKVSNETQLTEASIEDNAADMVEKADVNKEDLETADTAAASVATEERDPLEAAKFLVSKVMANRKRK